MRFLILCGVCLAFLSGCTAAEKPTTAEGPPVMTLETAPVYETAASISLRNAEPYIPCPPLEPDRVSADTMGDILCSTTLPDGRSVVCYWEPGSEFTKYWALRQGDSLLRFHEEYSAYEDGYWAEPFTDILGQDGFRITAPRGAAYMAYDYYTLDETGTPHLLADCANDVIAADINEDGVEELLWFYHGGRDIFYLFLQDGKVCQLCLTDALSEQQEPWLAAADSLELTDEACLPVRALPHNSTEPVSFSDFLPGRLRFTEDTVYLELEAPTP